jgi:hypothetical protein
MDVSFDRETNKLCSHCDNTCANRSTILAVDTTPGPTFGRFRVRAAYDRPTTMPDINNEGIAFARERVLRWAEELLLVRRQRHRRHSIRRDSIPCGPFAGL